MAASGTTLQNQSRHATHKSVISSPRGRVSQNLEPGSQPQLGFDFGSLLLILPGELSQKVLPLRQPISGRVGERADTSHWRLLMPTGVHCRVSSLTDSALLIKGTLCAGLCVRHWELSCLHADRQHLTCLLHRGSRGSRKESARRIPGKRAY